MKIQNDKNIFQNLNDVRLLNDVEKGNLCGPENSMKVTYYIHRTHFTRKKG
jgi:hypothetical protein